MYLFNCIAPGMVERNDGQKETGTLCSKEGQREKERQGKERWKREEEKEVKLLKIAATHTSSYMFSLLVTIIVCTVIIQCYNFIRLTHWSIYGSKNAQLSMQLFISIVFLQSTCY